MQNRTKQLLRDGQHAIGCFIFLGDPSVVEIAGIAGMDFVIIDMEHSPRDMWAVEQMIRAADVVGVTPLVRVPGKDENVILGVLDSGAQGVVVPGLENGAEAHSIVNAIRYPPAGARGTCTVTRATRYGLFRPRFGEYTITANDEILIVGMIESRKGLDNADEILAAGVEVAFVGRADLSAALGVPGEKEDPRALAGLASVVAAVERHRQTRADTWAGMTPYRDPDSNAVVTADCEFIVQQVDAFALLDTWRTGIAETRESIQQHAAVA